MLFWLFMIVVAGVTVVSLVKHYWDLHRAKRKTPNIGQFFEIIKEELGEGRTEAQHDPERRLRSRASEDSKTKAEITEAADRAQKHLREIENAQAAMAKAQARANRPEAEIQAEREQRRLAANERRAAEAEASRKLIASVVSAEPRSERGHEILAAEIQLAEERVETCREKFEESPGKGTGEQLTSALYQLAFASYDAGVAIDIVRDQMKEAAVAALEFGAGSGYFNLAVSKLFGLTDEVDAFAERIGGGRRLSGYLLTGERDWLTEVGSYPANDWQREECEFVDQIVEKPEQGPQIIAAYLQAWVDEHPTVDAKRAFEVAALAQIHGVDDSALVDHRSYPFVLAHFLDFGVQSRRLQRDDAAHQAVTVAQLKPLFELLTFPWHARTPSGPLVEQLEAAFLAVGPWEPQQELAPGDLLIGLTHALHQEQWGFWFDLSEDFLLDERCNGFIDYRVGRPDAFWTDPDNYNSFAWAGDDVTEGLLAFDDWLVADQAAHNQRDGDYFPPYRLIEINTQADYVLSMYCNQRYVEEAVALLANLGVRSRLQTADESWPTATG